MNNDLIGEIEEITNQLLNDKLSDAEIIAIGNRVKVLLDRNLENSEKLGQLIDLIEAFSPETTKSIINSVLVRRAKLLGNLAELYIRLRMHAEADQLFSLSTNLYPQDPEIWRRYGFLNFNQKNFSKAILCYEKSLELQPLQVGVLKFLAESYEELRDFRESGGML
ncbi:MAG: tetratricopeptide repeat protein [Nitrososphaerales archaeon]